MNRPSSSRSRDASRRADESALGLPLRGRLRAQALLCLPELRREGGTEVLRLEHLADLDLGLPVEGVGAVPYPFVRLFLRPHLEEPYAGDRLLRVVDWHGGHGAC